MTRGWLGCSFLLILMACGEGGAPVGPKERRNEERPVQRVLRQLREVPPAAPERRVEAPSGPVAEAEAPFAAPAEPPLDVLGVTEPLAEAPPTVAAGTPPARAAVEEPSTTPASASPERAVTEASTPEPPAVSTSAEESAPIVLTRLVVASAVEAREPTGVAPFTAAPERVYVFLEAENPGPADRAVHIVFDGPAATGQPVTLDVPVSRRWRTWATTRHVEPGHWTVRVLDEQDHELGRVVYEIPEDGSLAT